MTHIPKKLRELVSQKGKYRCGYCLTSEAIVGAPMEMDHYVPESLGGATEEHNLWTICSLCNVYKSNKIAVRDPVSGENVPVFNPQKDSWYVRSRKAWILAGWHPPKD